MAQETEWFGIYTIADLARIGGTTPIEMHTQLEHYEGPMQREDNGIIRLRAHDLRAFKAYLSAVQQGLPPKVKKRRKLSKRQVRSRLQPERRKGRGIILPFRPREATAEAKREEVPVTQSMSEGQDESEGDGGERHGS